MPGRVERFPSCIRIVVIVGAPCLPVTVLWVRTTPYSTTTCQQVAVASGMSSGVEQVGGVHYFLVGVSAGDGYLGELWLATPTGSGLHKMAQAQEWGLAGQML